MKEDRLLRIIEQLAASLEENYEGIEDMEKSLRAYDAMQAADRLLNMVQKKRFRRHLKHDTETQKDTSAKEE